MQRTQFRIEKKLINDLTVNDGRRRENFKETNNVKNKKEIRKFFDGFKRAMSFGSWKIEFIIFLRDFLSNFIIFLQFSFEVFINFLDFSSIFLIITKFSTHFLYLKAIASQTRPQNSDKTNLNLQRFTRPSNDQSMLRRWINQTMESCESRFVTSRSKRS